MDLASMSIQCLYSFFIWMSFVVLYLNLSCRYLFCLFISCISLQIDIKSVFLTSLILYSHTKVNNWLYFIPSACVHTITFVPLPLNDTVARFHPQYCGTHICIILGRSQQGNYPCGILLVGLRHIRPTRFSLFTCSFLR
jgi:hypothetical protein